MPRFSNRPFLATTLSLFVIPRATALSYQRPSPCLSSRAKRADLQCAIRVPRFYRSTTSTHHHRILMEILTSPLSFRVPGVVRGTADRSARNDKEERLVFPSEFGDDGWRLWAGRSGAHEWRTAGPLASLGMTNKGRVVGRKGRLLNRGIFKSNSAVPAGLDIEIFVLTRLLAG
jgi:hypothetical protein